MDFDNIQLVNLLQFLKINEHREFGDICTELNGSNFNFYLLCSWSSEAEQTGSRHCH